ncbi:MAG: HAD-IIA family hydrolase [Nocardioidaceae bacterium]
MLKPCDSPLWDAYDLAMLDLDGVVYIGPEAVPGAPEHLGKARAAGMHLAYITNNAARPPADVAEHLTDLGIPVGAEDVVTSAQAAARLLAEQLPQRAPVYVIGGTGLVEALREQELTPVQEIADQPVAVVSGFHRDLRWGTVIDGAILVRRGLPWVATNTDLTVPTQDGPGPGNGVLVGVVADFAERQPVVAGKPKAPLFEETLRRVGGERPLVVGDRLDTDIAGAVHTGHDSLLVLTGVTGLEELVAARPEERPTYLASDLAALGRPQPAPDLTDGEATLAGWRAVVHEGRLAVSGSGEADDWWRVVAAAAWAHLDATGRPVAADGLEVPSSVAPGR